MTINGSGVSKGETMPLLPNSDHPYDHYLITTRILKWQGHLIEYKYELEWYELKIVE